MPRNIEDGNMRTMISIPSLADRWDASKSMIYNKVIDGVIPAKRLGDRWFVSMDFVNNFETGGCNG